jgi:hypothetical protein
MNEKVKQTNKQTNSLEGAIHLLVLCRIDSRGVDLPSTPALPSALDVLNTVRLCGCKLERVRFRVVFLHLEHVDKPPLAGGRADELMVSVGPCVTRGEMQVCNCYSCYREAIVRLFVRVRMRVRVRVRMRVCVRVRVYACLCTPTPAPARARGRES